MKRYIYNSLLLFLICSVLTSCTEDVILDLKGVEPKLIIDASFPNGKPCTVLLTTTQDYYDNSPAPVVTGAVITLADNLGNIDTLTEVNSGVYVSPSLIGTPGLTYTLNIESKGKQYSSTADFPYTVDIDSIYFMDIKMGDKNFYTPVIIYQDPPDIENFYYSSISVNGKRLRTIFLNNDEYKDGKRTEYVTGFNSDDNDGDNLKMGDVVEIEMRSINKSAYEFYASLYSTVVANPTSSFSGGAIGCFMTYGSSTIQAQIKTSNTVIRE